jgi:homoserine O-succinyltransferase
LPLILSEASQRLPQVQYAGMDCGTAPKNVGCIDIGLVNNMPDAALQATERQFIALLAATAGAYPVRLSFFSLPDFPRGTAAAAHIRAHYSAIETLGRFAVQALIVTGGEPHAASLADGPSWPGLMRLVDWADSNTVSALWCGPAAHAAVLHLDGIRPHRLPRKRSGIFDFLHRSANPLLAGVPAVLEVSHSRWNDLHETELRTCGYEVLTVSPEGGVDLFVKPGRSTFLFFQGHPEHEAESIAQEYRRDVGRYLRDECTDYPSLPHNYFDSATETALIAFEGLALANRMALGHRALPRKLALRPGLAEHWQSTTSPIFRNWIDMLEQKRT